MFECIARAVDAGSLAVPDTEHAIDILAGVRFNLLRTKDCRCGQVFIDGRQEFDVAFLKKPARAPQLLVHHAERRAAVAADEAGGIQAGGLVHVALHERDADERLGACHEDAPRLASVAVDEFVVIKHSETVWQNHRENGCLSFRKYAINRYTVPK